MNPTKLDEGCPKSHMDPCSPISKGRLRRSNCPIHGILIGMANRFVIVMALLFLVSCTRRQVAAPPATPTPKEVEAWAAKYVSSASDNRLEVTGATVEAPDAMSGTPGSAVFRIGLTLRVAEQCGIWRTHGLDKGVPIFTTWTPEALSKSSGADLVQIVNQADQLQLTFRIIAVAGSERRWMFHFVY